MQHAEKQKAEQDTSDGDWWRARLRGLVEQPIDKQLAEVGRLFTNPRLKNSWLSIEVQLYRLHLCFSMWLAHPDKETFDSGRADAVRDHFTVQAMRYAKGLFEQGGLFPTAVITLETILKAIGLSCYFPSLLACSPARADEDRALNFKFVKLLRSKTKAPAYKFMHITEDPVVWQLRLFGEFMDRSMDSQPDPRVSFEPDAWQRQVLDCLDEKGHSVLVVGESCEAFVNLYRQMKWFSSADQCRKNLHLILRHGTSAQGLR